MTESPLTLFGQGIRNLRLVGLKVEVSEEPNLCCNLQVVKTNGEMTPMEMMERIDMALGSNAEMIEFWKPVLLNYTNRKAKKTDLNALTTRLLSMKK